MNCIKKFLINCTYTLIFSYKLIRNKFFRTKIEHDKEGSCYVLANGPSLKEDLPSVMGQNDFKGKDCIVLNFFCFNDSFFDIKPEHYCLADPMLFISKDQYKDQTSIDFINREKLYSILNKVNWTLSLYIPNRLYANFKKYIKLENKYIKVFRINDLEYKGFDHIKRFLYRTKLAAPPFQTVANMSIYVGLMKNYTQIKVYGLDHTFFEDLYVNEFSQLCSLDKHFYDVNKRREPIPLKYEDGTQVRISDYIQSIGNMFKAHDELEIFSKYLGKDIINCTSNTLVDSYKRI